MATYGLGSNIGFVPFTGYSPTLGVGDAITPSSSGRVYNNGISQADNDVARCFRNGAQMLAVKQLMLTILGAAPGTTATKTKAQVQHVIGAPGGAVPIETISMVNRATTAADVTAFTALINRQVFPATYVADVGGNGGGGKAGI